MKKSGKTRRVRNVAQRMSGRKIRTRAGQVKKPTRGPGRLRNEHLVPHSAGEDLTTFLSPLSFRFPERMVASAWHEHAPLAFWLVEQLRPRSIVELGTHVGFSYFAFCQAARMANVGAALFAVDHWTGDEHAGFYGEEVYQSVATYNSERYPDISTLMRMTFSDALSYFDDGSIDLLHIDGRHHFDDVKDDFETWLPKLSTRAVVLLHDTNIRDRQFGVHRFFAEQAARYSHFNFVHGCGLGVLGIGRDLPKPVANLFNASANETLVASIRGAYARLGGAVAQTFRANEEYRNRIERERQFQEQKRASESFIAERDAARSAAEERAQEAARLGSELEGARAAGREREQDAARLARELDAARQFLRDSQAEVQRLTGEIDAARQEGQRSIHELSATREELTTREQRVGMLAGEVEAARAEAARLGSELEGARAAGREREQDTARLARELDAARQFLRDSQTEVLRLAGEIDAARQEGQRSIHELSAALEELTTREQRINMLAGEVETARAEAARLGSELEWARAAGREREQDATRLAREFDAARQFLRDSQAEVQRLSGEIDEVRREDQRKGDQLTVARGEIAFRDRRIGELSSELAPLRNGKVGVFRRLTQRLRRANVRDKTHQWEYDLIRKSKLFDALWYLKRYPDVAAAGNDPLWHYIRFGAAENRDPHPLFDTKWYRTQAVDLVELAVSPLAHYVSSGVVRGLDPHPLFDADWYLMQNPDVVAAHVNPLYHFMKIGGSQGLDPHPLFDTSSYLEENPDVSAANDNPLYHYLAHGAKEGRSPNSRFDASRDQNPSAKVANANPVQNDDGDTTRQKFESIPNDRNEAEFQLYPKQINGRTTDRDPTCDANDVRNSGPRCNRDEESWDDWDLISQSGLFDTQYYFHRNPDVAGSGEDPVRHYLDSGARESRDPHPLFDSDWYLANNADVRSSGDNPLVHYLRVGALEGRSPHPLFDAATYLAQNEDVRTAGNNPLIHYLNFGGAEGRDPNPLFDSDWYLAENTDVAEAHTNPLVHYVTFGANEGRDPSALFDSRWYLETYPDVAEAREIPLIHYLKHGIVEGREIRPRRERLPIDLPKPIDHYSAWLTCNEYNGRTERALREALVLRRGSLPRISVVMPVYDPPIHLFEETIKSVVAQLYQDWELCIADDASQNPDLERVIKQWATADNRIKYTRREINGGISAATNSAATLASGTFIALLDHDDLLTPDSLAEVAIYAADHPDADIIYSDDDKIDMEGRLYDVQFKPDWSPTLLLSYMYLSHFLVLRRAIFDEVGGMRREFDGSQDYDLALRVSERARRVGHIPRVLYHWRAIPTSTAISTTAKPYSLHAGLRAVQAAFERRNYKGILAQPEWARLSGNGIYTPSFPDTGPRVSIVIPTKNKHDLLANCLSSIQATTYQNYEVVIVDNESDDPGTLRLLSTCGHRVLRIPSPNGRFSFAHINNAAVGQIDSDFVLFLNNDTEIINPKWLSQMMGYAQMAHVSAVGAKLLFRNGTIQHNGIVHGFNDRTSGHAFKNVPDEGQGYLSYLKVAREVSGVTAACLLTKRALFLDLGGFDETNFAIAYNDVDFCYRLIDNGYLCVVCPEATLYHDEGASRGFIDNPAEVAEIRRRYRQRIDPWYSPNLSLDNERFEIRPYRLPLRDGRPLRMVAVTHNLNYEGAPRHQLEIITALRRRENFDVTVLSPHDGPLRAHYESAGVTIEIISLEINDRPQFDRTIQNIARTFRQAGADVVYANTMQTFWAIVAAEEASISALWNLHESESWESYFDFLSADIRDVAYRCFHYPYRVAFVAYATRRFYEPLNSHHNFTTIHNGFDLQSVQNYVADNERLIDRRRLGIADLELAVVLVGTVCERKGQIDLVRAIKLLPPDLCERARFFFVGDRPSSYSSRLHLEAHELPVPERAVIVPETSEPFAYFNAADIVVCCSRVESYPRVILEAMAFDLPIITTPVFGIKEQVQNELSALFYEPMAAGELAEQLSRLLTNDELRKRLGRNASSALAALPSFDEMLDAYCSLFQEARLSRGSIAIAPNRNGP
jgi:GT2 family glycosyltransferase/glycosyltransferase involved in cell wall biosynthesis